VDDSKPAKQRSKKLPPLTLLSGDAPSTVQEQDIILMARNIEKTLSEFGVDVRVAGYRAGPTVIQFAVEPGTYEKTGPDGLPQLLKYKVSQINDLRKDLALALAARTLRIVPVVPGQSFLGIEVPNPQTSIVHLRTVMDSDVFKAVHSPLAIALGRDVAGKPVAFDLAKMPHLLIGGTTGSGKSVAIAAMATCLLMNNDPEDLRIAMLDPKMVELVRFNGVPHLMGKVETKVERMLNVLRWALVEMEHRLRIMEAEHARDLDTYNRKMVQKGSVKLPRVVVMIDELAELMQHAPEQTESSLVRLAQMARAVGIHLVVATQRPSTDVVTGKIKTNFPARVAFTVASGVDSRVIIDQNGAEDLLGKGDCLFMSPDAAGLTRVQGVFVSDKELDAVVGFWQNAQKDEPKESAPWEEIKSEEKSENGFDEALIQKAIEVVRRSQRASASMLQMRLRIGFPRASRLLDLLEEMGIVGPAVGSGRERDVLISEQESEDSDDAPEE
jgi:S-DNA-T family DNA segregation ATPase FtsK/SpoIIIE